MKKKILNIIAVFSFLTIVSLPVVAQDSEQNYTYYYNLGYAKLIDGSFDDAINIFEQTLAIKPDCTEAFLGLGIAYRQKNDLQNALIATQKALKIDPDYFKAYYNLGLIYEQLGNKKDALEAYNTFYKRVPEAKNIPDLKQKIDQLKKET